MGQEIKEHQNSKKIKWSLLQNWLFTDIKNISKITIVKVKGYSKITNRKIRNIGKGAFSSIKIGSKKIHNNFENIFKGILTIMVLIVLKAPIEQFFEEFLVNPIFSRVNFEDWIIELLFIIVIICIINWNAIFRFKNYVPSLTKSLFIIGLSLIYAYYRLTETNRWEIYDSKLGEFKTLDYVFSGIILVQLGVLIFYLGRQYWKGRLSSNTEKGFLEDLPINSVEEDEYGYKDYAEKMSKRVLATNNDKAAFAIGINGKWGTGKTSLMNIIRRQFKSEECIILDYDPWKSKDSSRIIPDFFDTLEEKISKYHFGIGRLVQAYSQSISEIESKSIVHYAVQLFIALFYPRGNSKLFKMLNNKIKGIGKKIIVFIDDLDRLDKSEIIQCLKLVRNSANFSNVVFIVAYDREYLVEAIKELNPHNKEFFLEKIFQLEVNLPYFDRQVLKDNFILKLRDELPSNKLEELGGIIGESTGVIITTDYFNEWVHHIRDVTRLANSLILNFSQIWNEVDLEDAIKIEMFRIKYPAIYKIFLTGKSMFLGSKFIEPSYFYSLTPQEPIEKPEHQSKRNSMKFTQYLKERCNSIDEYEISKISSLLISLFTIDSSAYHHKPDNPLSIRTPSRFLLYFQYQLGEGLISELDLLTSIQSFDALKGFIDKCVADKRMTKHLGNRMEYFSEFDNAKMYEIIVKGVFYFGNKVVKETFFNSDYLDHDFLCEIISSRKSVKYLKAEGSDFVRKVLTPPKCGSGLFNSNFLHRYLQRQNYFGDGNIQDGSPLKIPLELSEIQDLLVSYLESYTQRSLQLTQDHLILYYNCEQFEKDAKMDSREKNRKPIKKAKEIIRKFILSGNILPALKYMIKEDPRDNGHFSLHPVYVDIFDSEQRMKEMFDANSDQIKNVASYQEFCRFYVKYIKAEKIPVYFKFEHLDLI